MTGDRRLTPADIEGAMALSRAAGWNQTPEDWRMILRLGEGFGAFDAGRLVGSAAYLSYGGRIAWICMVLVASDARRQGYATRLMGRALAAARAKGLVAGLDATPEGRAVYRQLGFCDGFGITRMRGMGGEDGAGVACPMDAGDVASVAALDAETFGADRDAMLAALRSRAPGQAKVLWRDGALAGFALARDGDRATQIGPVTGVDVDAGMEMLRAAIAAAGGPVMIDVFDGADAARSWLTKRGFTTERGFTRMFDEAIAPTTSGGALAIAGPELG